MNPSGYSTGTGTPIEMVVPTDRVGMFVRRSGAGSGAVSVQHVTAVWDIAASGMAYTDIAELQAFGVEMVYVAQGNFALGSGGGESGHFYQYPTTTATYPVTSEGAITVGAFNGNLYYATTEVAGDQLGPIPAAFPKGYAAFYCMKYEISQGQYADFLNALTSTQAGNRWSAGGTRNTLTGTYPAIYATVPDRACNRLSWADGTAFADWAGLRPMTELEYEKACRGPLPPVANEYAWGNATRTLLTSETDDGLGTSTPNPANANMTTGQNGPYRVGLYATTNSTRAQAGATYWGIMEMTGNMWERPVTVGTPQGRAFTGLHGDGVLTSAGVADVSDWPSPSTALGSGVRSGHWQGSGEYTRVSDRTFGARAETGRTISSDNAGFRGVRTAP